MPTRLLLQWLFAVHTRDSLAFLEPNGFTCSIVVWEHPREVGLDTGTRKYDLEAVQGFHACSDDPGYLDHQLRPLGSVLALHHNDVLDSLSEPFLNDKTTQPIVCPTSVERRSFKSRPQETQTSGTFIDVLAKTNTVFVFIDTAVRHPLVLDAAIQ